MQRVYKDCEICKKSFYGDTYKKRFCGRTCFKVNMQNEKNVNWKGDLVGLDSLHSWIRKRLPKPAKCQNCERIPPYDLANISGKYKRELADWEWLCRKCHMLKDGRLTKFLNNQNRFL